jgi:hypothetical protein
MGAIDTGVDDGDAHTGPPGDLPGSFHAVFTKPVLALTHLIGKRWSTRHHRA